MKLSPHGDCCCAECVASRRTAVKEMHPIWSKADKEPTPTLIPTDQALAMELEARDMLKERLAEIEQNIKALRDCA